MELKEFKTEELEITLKALNVATVIRSELKGVAGDSLHDLADLAVEFALDAEEENFDEHIALVKAEIASRAN